MNLPPRCVALAAACLTLCACASTAPPSRETFPLIGNTQVHRYSLENGLRLLVVEDHSSPTFAYHTFFRVGSRDEIPGKTGLAHLFEHMMFKGTARYKEGEFDRILEQAGAEGENAFTSRDYTAYVQELPKSQLDLIAKLEADRMVNLVINEESFKTEVQVVQNERRFRTENNPDGTLYQELFATAFTRHPYRWPVIGSQQDLDSMSAKDAQEFYRTWYSPNHATLVIIGDVLADDAYRIVRKHYGSIAAQPDPVRKLPVEPTQTSPRVREMRLNIQVDKILLGFHVPGILSEEIPVSDVLSAVLTGGNSSRLHRALVDAGIASSVYAYDLEDRDPSLFIIGVALQEGRKPAQALAVIDRELRRLADAQVQEEELQRAKNRLNFAFYDGLNGNSEKANFLGRYEATAGDFRIGLRHMQRIPQVKADELREVARKYLTKSNRTLLTGVRK